MKVKATVALDALMYVLTILGGAFILASVASGFYLLGKWLAG